MQLGYSMAYLNKYESSGRDIKVSVDKNSFLYFLYIKSNAVRVAMAV